MSFGYGFGLPSWQTLSGGFNPSSLFVGGVQGTWYDPSDASTLFSDTAGTTPSPTPGAGALSVVGLMLDKSQGLVLGSELVVSPYSGPASGSWTVSATSVTRNSSTAGQASVNLGAAISTSKYYLVTFVVSNLSGDDFLFRIGAGGTAYRVSANGTYTARVIGGGTSSTIVFAPWAGSAGEATITNISIKELPGNHAISYNTTTARPELSARVNLLTYSEQFDNVVWTKSGTAVNTAAGIAPDGTNTANKIYPTSTGAFRQVFRTLTTVAISYVATVYAKAAEKNIIAFVDFAGSAGAAWFNLSTGVASNVVGGYTATITSVGNGWYRCSLTGTAPAGLGYYAVFVADSAGGSTGTANGTDGVLIWGADLRPANIGTSVPAYQRIADQYAYDSSGFPRYLVFNGTASGMYTPANLNLSGTDKATVFAGVRKLNQTVNQRIVELSNSTSTNAGSFQMWPGDWLNGTGPNYSFSSRGTTAIAQNQSAESPANYAAPISNVLGASGDIAGDSTILRINGSQVATGTGDQGAGNFGSYPLFVGNRNNSSLWFNGYIYSLIVVGAASTAAQISSTESWINVKEGGVY